MTSSDAPLSNVFFEYSGADIILRSHDSCDFRVPKSYIVNASPVFDKLISGALCPPDNAHGGPSLPVIQLPESGAILHSLLTFIFPVGPLVPSIPETAMELLSVAQKYQMVTVLDHIRGSIARQNPRSTQQDTALHIYALAQKYGLRQEALQAARTILKYPMNFADLEDKLGMMPGSALYELWKYYGTVRAILASDLTEFRTSGARGTLIGSRCAEFSSSQIPRWLDNYIESIGDAPHLFDVIGFHTALLRHLPDKGSALVCACKHIPDHTIRNFGEALTSVVQGSFEKADSALSLVQAQGDSQVQVNSGTSPTLPEPLDVPNADLIIRSSDLVDFRVHKPVLIMASPSFRDLLSLPKSFESETVDGLPVVQLSEDAELLNSLVSMLYPVRPVIPESYDKVLYLLAACQKYNMAEVQSLIRDEVNCGRFPAPVGTEVFSAYAIASGKGLIPEMENAARQTLDYPMTFETLGEGLRLFDCFALHDLVRFRKGCSDGLVTELQSFLKVQAPAPSSIWVGCPEAMPPSQWDIPFVTAGVVPKWLRRVLSPIYDSKPQVFTQPLTTPSNIREEYLTALQNHSNCNFCLRVHVKGGSTFCAELESKLAQALEKISPQIKQGKAKCHAKVLVELERS